MNNNNNTEGVSLPLPDASVPPVQLADVVYDDAIEDEWNTLLAAEEPVLPNIAAAPPPPEVRLHVPPIQLAKNEEVCTQLPPASDEMNVETPSVFTMPRSTERRNSWNINAPEFRPNRSLTTTSEDSMFASGDAPAPRTFEPRCPCFSRTFVDATTNTTSFPLEPLQPRDKLAQLSLTSPTSAGVHPTEACNTKRLTGLSMCEPSSEDVLPSAEEMRCNCCNCCRAVRNDPSSGLPVTLNRCARKSMCHTLCCRSCHVPVDRQCMGAGTPDAGHLFPTPDASPPRIPGPPTPQSCVGGVSAPNCDVFYIMDDCGRMIPLRFGDLEELKKNTVTVEEKGGGSYVNTAQRKESVCDVTATQTQRSTLNSPESVNAKVELDRASSVSTSTDDIKWTFIVRTAEECSSRSRSDTQTSIVETACSPIPELDRRPVSAATTNRNVSPTTCTGDASSTVTAMSVPFSTSTSTEMTETPPPPEHGFRRPLPSAGLKLSRPANANQNRPWQSRSQPQHRLLPFNNDATKTLNKEENDQTRANNFSRPAPPDTDNQPTFSQRAATCGRGFFAREVVDQSKFPGFGAPVGFATTNPGFNSFQGCAQFDASTPKPVTFSVKRAQMEASRNKENKVERTGDSTREKPAGMRGFNISRPVHPPPNFDTIGTNGGQSVFRQENPRPQPQFQRPMVAGSRVEKAKTDSKKRTEQEIEERERERQLRRQKREKERELDLPLAGAEQHTHNERMCKYIEACKAQMSSSSSADAESPAPVAEVEGNASTSTALEPFPESTREGSRKCFPAVNKTEDIDEEGDLVDDMSQCAESTSARRVSRRLGLYEEDWQYFLFFDVEPCNGSEEMFEVRQFQPSIGRFTVERYSAEELEFVLKKITTIFHVKRATLANGKRKVFPDPPQQSTNFRKHPFKKYNVQLLGLFGMTDVRRYESDFAGCHYFRQYAQGEEPVWPVWFDEIGIVHFPFSKVKELNAKMPYPDAEGRASAPLRMGWFNLDIDYNYVAHPTRYPKPNSVQINNKYEEENCKPPRMCKMFTGLRYDRNCGIKCGKMFHRFQCAARPDDIFMAAEDQMEPQLDAKTAKTNWGEDVDVGEIRGVFYPTNQKLSPVDGRCEWTALAVGTTEWLKINTFGRIFDFCPYDKVLERRQISHHPGDTEKPSREQYADLQDCSSEKETEKKEIVHLNPEDF